MFIHGSFMVSSKVLLSLGLRVRNFFSRFSHSTGTERGMWPACSTHSHSSLKCCKGRELPDSHCIEDGSRLRTAPTGLLYFGIRGTTTEGVQLMGDSKLIAEAKVCNLDDQVSFQKQVLWL